MKKNLKSTEIKQNKFIRAFLLSGKVIDACKKTGITRQTWYGWSKDSDFMKKLNRNIEAIEHILFELRKGLMGPDILTGSRFLSESEYNASVTKKILSICYNKLVDFIFKTQLSDYQCEFKAYKTFLITPANELHKPWIGAFKAYTVLAIITSLDGKSAIFSI